MTTVIEPGKVLLLGAGGAATNIISTHYGIQQTDGFAEIHTCFADTSLSNVRDKIGTKIKEEDVFIIEGSEDGGGKLKRLNYESIQQSIKPLLLKFKPEDLNILVFSASGG